MSDEIYIPLGCKDLSTCEIDPQKRVGIQGPPGTGKTWAGLTFPNPVVLNLDRGLGAHDGRKDVIDVPFYSPRFVDSIVKRDGLTTPPNRKDAVAKWLTTEGMKLKHNQTLVIDSLTQLNNAFHAQYALNPVVARSGKVDDFAEWKFKVEYFGEIMGYLKDLQCDVVMCCHETTDRDKTGELNGLVRPLITGQFGDQLASHFTDWFRSHAAEKPVTDERKEAFKKRFGVQDMKEGNDSTVYLWQTMSDEVVRHVKTSTLVNAPKFVVANYTTFSKYKRKTT